MAVEPRNKVNSAISNMSKAISRFAVLETFVCVMNMNKFWGDRFYTISEGGALKIRSSQ